MPELCAHVRVTMTVTIDITEDNRETRAVADIEAATDIDIEHLYRISDFYRRQRARHF